MNFFENFGKKLKISEKKLKILKKKLKILEKKFQIRRQILTARGVYGDKYCYIISYACLALFVLKETYTNENYSSWTPGT